MEKGNDMATFKALNFNQVMRAVKDFSERDIRNISRSAVRRSATRVRSEVKKRVPVDKGDLKNSIRVKSVRTKLKEPVSIVYSKIGYYNTLLYGVRNEQSGKQTPIANPKGNWWEKTTKEYGTTVKYDMAEFLDKGMKRASAKAYAKSLAGVKK